MNNDIYENDGTDWDNNCGDRMALLSPVQGMEYFNSFLDNLIGVDDLVEPVEDCDE